MLLLDPTEELHPLSKDMIALQVVGRHLMCGLIDLRRERTRRNPQLTDGR